MSQTYVRKQKPIEIEPWRHGADMARVRTVSDPKPGDVIARDPDNADDRWLITEKDFKENYEPEDE